MPREPIPTYFVALAVVRLGHRFLMIREAGRGNPWYLPAGMVEPGESFADGARREVLEEAGVPVRLDGILRVEHTPGPDHARVRVIFLASPLDDTPPKTTPDAHSLEARWVTVEEAALLPLRAPGLLALFEAVRDGQLPVLPLAVLGAEGPA